MMNAFNLLDQTKTIEIDGLISLGVEQAKRTGFPTLVSSSLPAVISAEEEAAISLFEAAMACSDERQFWSPPGENLTLVGVGCAWAFESLAGQPTLGRTRFQCAADAWRSLTDRAILSGAPSIRGVGPMLMGGFAFDSAREMTALWSSFPAGRLVLPQIVYTFLDDQCWITYNCVVGPETNPAFEAGNLLALHQTLSGHWAVEPEEVSLRRAVVLQREIRPALDWQSDVKRAADTVRQGVLEKVVLARAVELQATQPFEAGRALRWLADNYTGCYLFAIGRGSQCFLGATPERLARLENKNILTMSLAGSIKRGANAEEDGMLGQALLDSAKDRHEHAVVVQSIVEALDPLCSSLTVSEEPSLLKLSNIQHICTTITGSLGQGRSLFDLIEALHPTPAVGGRPREASLALIRECEKLDRGWYAGPVGWVDSDGDGEFAVALRSALLQEHTATLFAGCGIVADSDPEREYAESMLKLKPMQSALGL